MTFSTLRRLALTGAFACAIAAMLDAAKRPVSAVADQREYRDVETVEVNIDRSQALTLLFDPEHALDDRIAMEQFAIG